MREFIKTPFAAAVAVAAWRALCLSAVVYFVVAFWMGGWIPAVGEVVLAYVWYGPPEVICIFIPLAYLYSMMHIKMRRPWAIVAGGAGVGAFIGSLVSQLTLAELGFDHVMALGSRGLVAGAAFGLFSVNAWRGGFAFPSPRSEA